MSAQSIILKYSAFFEARGHKRIGSNPLVPENDPTTLFTSAGMQPLIPYLLGRLQTFYWLQFYLLLDVAPFFLQILDR